MSDFPIDAVYTWVDAQDPFFQALWEKSGQAGAPPWQRFRSHNELWYSLLSLRRHAPWVRKIFLVTNGQQPPRLPLPVTLVSHDELFPDTSHLPVFNSNAIEMHLHRISGLADHFLYFNDDLLLGRRVTPAHYWEGGRQIFYLEKIPLHRDPEHGRIHDRSYAYTLRQIEGVMGPVSMPWLPAHCPQLYQKKILQRIEKRYAAACARTSGHRQREADDLVMRLVYLAEVMQTCRQEILAWGSADYTLLCLSNNRRDMLRAFVNLLLRPPRFLCLNDDLPDRPDPLVAGMLRWYLRLSALPRS